MWEKNGVKIAGAVTTNLTLPGLVFEQKRRELPNDRLQQLRLGHQHPSRVNQVVSNPFTHLTGIYHGLFLGGGIAAGAVWKTRGLSDPDTPDARHLFRPRVLNAGGSYSFSGTFSVTGQALASVPRRRTGLAAADCQYES